MPTDQSTRPRLFAGANAREAGRLAEVLRRETVGGALLVLAAAAAIVWINSPAGDSYTSLHDTTIGPRTLLLDLSLGTWAADGLLAVFFFVAGLELRRESSPEISATLPAPRCRWPPRSVGCSSPRSCTWPGTPESGLSRKVTLGSCGIIARRRPAAFLWWRSSSCVAELLTDGAVTQIEVTTLRSASSRWGRQWDYLIAIDLRAGSDAGVLVDGAACAALLGDFRLLGMRPSVVVADERSVVLAERRA